MPSGQLTAKKRAELETKAAKALELALSGMTYEAIAKQIGYANRSSAYEAVQRALVGMKAENVAEYRAMAGARLEALLAAVWPKAMDGEPQAHAAALRTVDRWARLWGLDLPQQVQISGSIEHEVTDPQARLAVVRQLADQLGSRVIEHEPDEEASAG